MSAWIRSWAWPLGLALCCLVAMGLLIVLTVRAAKPVPATAARLLLPYYGAWVTYASWLNAGIVFLNR